MTISSVGSLTSKTATGNTTLAPTNNAVGNLMIVYTTLHSATVSVTTPTGGGATGWTRVRGPDVDTNATFGSQTHELWIATVSTTGAQTISFTLSGAFSSDFFLGTREFHSTLGTAAVWALDDTQNGFQNNASGTTIPYPSLSAPPFGGLYFGHAFISGGGAAAGSDPGFTYESDTDGDSVIWHPTMAGKVTPTGGRTGTNTSYPITAMITDGGGWRKTQPPSNQAAHAAATY